MENQVNGEISESAAVHEDDEYFSSFPPGFRFKPLDEELIVHYLIKKVNNQPLPRNQIKEVQLYSYGPDTLADMYKPNCEDEWYFFTRRDRKYPNGSRPKRDAGNGYWKATGATVPIFFRGEKVGLKTSLCFYSGNQQKSNKTNWLMTEYKVFNDMKFDDWVLCKIRKLKEKPDESEKSRQPAEGPPQPDHASGGKRNFGDSSFVRAHQNGIPGSSEHPVQRDHTSSAAHSQQASFVAGHNNQSTKSLFLQPHNVPIMSGRSLNCGNSDFVYSHQSGFLGQKMAAGVCDNHQPTESAFLGQDYNYDGSSSLYSYPNDGSNLEQEQASASYNQQSIVVSCNNINQPTESFFETHYNQPIMSEGNQNCGAADFVYSHQKEVSRSLEHHKSCDNSQPRKGFLQPHYVPSIPNMSGGNHICGNPSFAYSHWNGIWGSSQHNDSFAYNQQSTALMHNYNVVPRTHSDVGSSSQGQDVAGSETPAWDQFFDPLEKDIKDIGKDTKG